MSDESHAKCVAAGEHVCQRPSGRTCLDCDHPAGTWWGPMWCPVHDKERLDRCSAGLEAALASLRESL